MNKIIFLVPFLLIGCASTSDITNLQVQIDGINAEVHTLNEKTSQSLALSKGAYINAVSANESAEKALKEIQLTNEKITELLND